MGERETQLDREPGDVGVSVDGLEESATTRRPTSSSESRRERLTRRATSVFSPRAFLVSTVVTLLGFLVVGGLLPLGGIANLVGIAAGTFATGLATSQSRYAESAVAGGAVGGVAAFLDHLALTVVGVGLPLLALGAVGGLLAGLLGHYFGRDLRAGLTRDL